MRKFQASIVGVVAVVALANVASARGPSGPTMRDSNGNGFTPAGDVGGLAAGLDATFNVTGYEGWDSLGDSSNDILILDVAAAVGLPSGTPVMMNGIGWDVRLTALGASWLDENVMAFSDAIGGAPGLFLTVGAGNSFPGEGLFSSGGVIKLGSATIPDVPLPNGVLKIEIFESFDDVADAVDSIYKDLSTITVQVTPEPASLLGLGLAGLVALRRRR